MMILDVLPISSINDNWTNAYSTCLVDFFRSKICWGRLPSKESESEWQNVGVECYFFSSFWYFLLSKSKLLFWWNRTSKEILPCAFIKNPPISGRISTWIWFEPALGKLIYQENRKIFTRSWHVFLGLFDRVICYRTRIYHKLLYFFFVGGRGWYRRGWAGACCVELRLKLNNYPKTGGQPA